MSYLVTDGTFRITSICCYAKQSKANRCHCAEQEECDFFFFFSYKYTIYPSTLYLHLSQYLNPDSALYVHTLVSLPPGCRMAGLRVWIKKEGVRGRRSEGERRHFIWRRASQMTGAQFSCASFRAIHLFERIDSVLLSVEAVLR